MTIFLEIARHYLVAEIVESYNRMLQDDSGYISSWMRDADVSKEKQKLALRFKEEIEKIRDSSNDNETLNELKKCLFRCRKQARDLCVTSKCGEGKLGKELMAAVSLLIELERVLREDNMWDVPHDSDAYNIFRYYAACYFVEKAVDYFKGNQPFYNNVVLEYEKQNLLRKSLESCSKALDGLDSRKSDYLDI